MQRYQLQENDQIYFLHIPKTAGMSLMHTLYSYFPTSDKRHFLVGDLVKSPDVLRNRPFIPGHLFFTVHHFLERAPLYITMLREPTAHVISLFRHIKRLEDHPLHKKFKDATLLEFLHSPQGKATTTNFQTLSLGADNDPRLINKTDWQEDREEIVEAAQARFKDLDPKTQIDIAKARLEKFAFVGITELFEESLQLLTYTFHWQPSQEVLNYNTDPEKPSNIPEEARELIAERTQLDAQLYQFGRELMQRRRREMIFDLLKTDSQVALSEQTSTYAGDTPALPDASDKYKQDIWGWSDGWAGPRWVLSWLGLPTSVKTVEIKGKTFSSHFKSPLNLTVLINGAVVEQIQVKRNKFTIKIPVTRGNIEILADQYFIPAQKGRSPDHRPLSWLIDSINLTA